VLSGFHCSLITGQFFSGKKILISIENFQELFSGAGLIDIAKLIQSHPIIKLL
jgi:hypothetical protein